jgi:predicted RNA-binding Zn-ribbon protein involved in translation (DUF1610 family)
VPQDTPEGSAPPRAPELLRAYLATRNIYCESCGYNLKGADTVQCPECGTVIPRPPADYIDRVRTQLPDLRLACLDCEYTITGVDAVHCPECGSQRLMRFAGDTPPRRSRRRRVPLLLLATTGVGILIALAAASMVLMQVAAARPIAPGSQPILALVIALFPLGTAGAWLKSGKLLSRLEPGEHKALATGAFIITVAAIGLAIRFLA